MTLSMTRAWDSRPIEVATLLNPAFCAFVLLAATREHHSESRKGMPLPIAFLILPVVLHRATREALPRSTRTRMVPWLSENQVTRLDLARRMGSLVPYTREAVIFAIQNGVLGLTDEARLVPNATRLRAYQAERTGEVSQILRAAKLLGRWTAREGDTVTVLATWGVKL